MPATALYDLPRHRLLAELSLWSADLTRLAEDIARTEAHADLFHIDVADGHFTPAMLFFPDLVAKIRTLTRRPLHVHLMTSAAIALPQIDQFADAGADLISVHVELDRMLPAALDAILARGCAAGLVLKLETPVEACAPWLRHIRFLTLLGTALGVKGQNLSEQACDRLGQARLHLRAAGREAQIVLAADGGIRANTVPALHNAGAQTVVMGSLAFAAPDLPATMQWLHGLPAEAARQG